MNVYGLRTTFFLSVALEGTDKKEVNSKQEHFNFLFIRLGFNRFRPMRLSECFTFRWNKKYLKDAKKQNEITWNFDLGMSKIENRISFWVPTTAVQGPIFVSVFSLKRTRLKRDYVLELGLRAIRCK